MPLTTCTLTGIDDNTDLSHVEMLSYDYPFVEWGVLYSPKRTGEGGRYPTVKTIREMLTLPDNIHVALHICGKGVSDFIDGEPVITELVDLVRQREGRIQLNFNAMRATFNMGELILRLKSVDNIDFITQYNEANQHITDAIHSCTLNHAVLFDASGGQGKVAEHWQYPLPSIYCGYAGGLGPNNIEVELPKIELASDNTLYWIDMEGKLRDEHDWFDLHAAAAVLYHVNQFLGKI